MLVFGRPLCPDLWIKVAYILQKITKKHIFSDGNKRTSFIATKLFLKKNGYDLVVSKDEGISLMLKYTTSEDNEQEMEKIDKFLKDHAQKIS